MRSWLKKYIRKSHSLNNLKLDIQIIYFHRTGEADKLHILSRLGIEIFEMYFYRRFSGITKFTETNDTVEYMTSIFIKAKIFESKLFADDWVALKIWDDFIRCHEANVVKVLT